MCAPCGVGQSKGRGPRLALPHCTAYSSEESENFKFELGLSSIKIGGKSTLSAL